jgi:hypothetical protein
MKATDPPVRERVAHSWCHLLQHRLREHLEPNLPAEHTSEKQVGNRLALLAAKGARPIVAKAVAPLSVSC